MLAKNNAADIQRRLTLTELEQARYEEAQRISADRERADLAWFALWCNPRCEKRAVIGLVDAGFVAYTPHGRKWSKPKRATTYVMRNFPAYTRYVFVAFPGQYADWHTVRRTDGIESLVGIQGAPLRLTGLAIEAIRAAEAAGRFNIGSDPGEAKPIGYPVCYLPGAFGTVEKGAFAGHQYRVVKRSNSPVVQVELLLFGRETVAKVPIADIAA